MGLLSFMCAKQFDCWVSGLGVGGRGAGQVLGPQPARPGPPGAAAAPP